MNKAMRNSIYFGIVICSFVTHSNAQTISRSVICPAGETVIKPQLSLTYVIGEPVADLLAVPQVHKYLTVGFAQPDIELKEILNADISNKVTLFPNPASSIVKIALNNVPDANYSIDLVDMMGRILQTININFSNNNYLYVEMNVAQYASGMYVVRVRSDKDFKGQVKLLKR
ncbi:T9SS type A sorting domain-containing protein [Danxiaibacter flavus]|uniref:T9SS type A sorting domain-containing protein n=1 Tax=Danxiaibacter flavus TaxID=3049108 RepID=A0ABV3ZH42_9BACT|nr:T9SS type A sorting domain-containing protein [Chitinophagaceae bacterium DXS]WJK45026.1 T9SS type A sorting domain-containing protein [Chitinophagaceae bacterium DXS]